MSDSVEKRLAVVEAHSEFCNQLLEKMDTSISKQVDILTELGKIVAVHENRLDAIVTVQDNTTKTVTSHSKYLWMAIGILAALGFLAKVVPSIIALWLK